MRTPAAVPSVVDVTQQSPASFSSLADFLEHRQRPKSHPEPKSALARIPYSIPKAGPRTGGKHRFCVCHDYKGGYIELDNERGYTFNWWHLVDSFIYFAHHRVSPPPRAWIQAAHRHGVKMLGTLIFEGDEGGQDLSRLLELSNEGSAPRLTATSLNYADGLIDLCLERGFEGWLVNVEVPFVEGQETKQMQAMLLWLQYLKDEARRRIGPGSEIMWYDAVNLLGLQWQNELNDYTLPFAEVADSIFLNYWWRDKEIEATTTKFAENWPPLEMEQIYFGLDVWGRGQFGGGGFGSWIALDLLDRVTKKSLQNVAPGMSTDAGYPVAVFAPGWTVESLGHELTDPKGYGEWFADDAHLWIGTPQVPKAPTPLPSVGKIDVAPSALKQNTSSASVTSVAAGPVDNANQTAQKLTSLESTLAASLVSQIFEPLSTYSLERNRPPPNLNGSFWTCFSRGSGHGFFVEGKKEATWDKGWTDLNLTYPFPCLAVPSTNEGIQTDLVEDEAWFGPCALRIESTCSDTRRVPINATAVPLMKGKSVLITMVWKESSPSAMTGKASLGLFASDAHGPLQLGDVRPSEEAQGWHTVSARIESDVDTTITSCGVDVTGGSKILVGSIHLTDDASRSGTFAVTGARWASSNERVEWEFSGASPSDCATLILMYTVWSTRHGEEPMLLGVTSDQYFALSRSAFPESAGRIGVRAMAIDGTLGPLVLVGQD